MQEVRVLPILVGFPHPTPLAKGLWCHTLLYATPASVNLWTDVHAQFYMGIIQQKPYSLSIRPWQLMATTVNGHVFLGPGPWPCMKLRFTVQSNEYLTFYTNLRQSVGLCNKFSYFPFMLTVLDCPDKWNLSCQLVKEWWHALLYQHNVLRMHGPTNHL